MLEHLQNEVNEVKTEIQDLRATTESLIPDITKKPSDVQSIGCDPAETEEELQNQLKTVQVSLYILRTLLRTRQICF